MPAAANRLTFVACGSSCPARDHEGYCLVCGQLWHFHNGHTCPLQAGGRGSWRVFELTAYPTPSLPDPPQPTFLERLRRVGWFDPEAPIRLDVTFSSAVHKGHETTLYSRSQVSSMPMLAPLVLSLKLLLSGHGLNDSFTGGLSSFGMLILAQVFLQHTLACEWGGEGMVRNETPPPLLPPHATTPSGSGSSPSPPPNLSGGARGVADTTTTATTFLPSFITTVTVQK